MPLWALLVLLLAVPIAELYVIYLVGDAIGVIWTLLLLAASSVLGAVLLRSEGRSAWRRFGEAVSAGRVPHREVVDGVLIVFGGAFLLTPGFLTDIVGIVLLLPPTRALVRGPIARRLGGGIVGGFASGRGRRAGRSYDVDGTATEYPTPPQGRLER